MPLAVRIAGARLVARPHWRVARVAELLEDERHRLDELATGDLGVRPSLAVSARALDPAAAAAFGLLGTLDVPDFGAWVVSPLLEVPVAEAEELVERLVDAHLLEAVPGPPVRYRFHDLVRDFARERSGPAAAAHERAFGAWLALAETAAAALPSGFRRIGPGSAPRWPVPSTADPLAWLEAERAALVAVVAQAAAEGRTELAWELACALARFFELREHIDEWRVSTETALAAVRAAGDRRGEAHLLRSLGELHLDCDRYADARDCLDRARALLPEAPQVWRGLGTALRLLGDTDRAAACLHRSLALAAGQGDVPGQVQALHGLGVLDRRLGRPGTAVTRYRAALRLLAGRPDPFAEAYVLDSLALALGDDPEVADCLRRSLALCRQVGYRRGEALTLGHLGDWHRRRGAYAQAEVELTAAVATCRELGERPGEAVMLCRLGETLRDGGDLPAAVRVFGESARLAAALGRTEDATEAERLRADALARTR